MISFDWRISQVGRFWCIKRQYQLMYRYIQCCKTWIWKIRWLKYKHRRLLLRSKGINGCIILWLHCYLFIYDLTSCKMTFSNTPQNLARSESRVLSIWLSTIVALEMFSDEVIHCVSLKLSNSWRFKLSKTSFTTYKYICNWKRF